MPRVLASDYQTAQFEFSFTSQRPKTPLNLSRILGKTGGNWFEAGVFYFLPAGLPIALVPTAGRDTRASDSTSGCVGANDRATRDDWFQSNRARRLPACVL